MNEIYLALTSRPGQLAAICLTTVLIVAIGLRLRANRIRKFRERKGGDCLTAKLAWSSLGDAENDRIKRILAGAKER